MYLASQANDCGEHLCSFYTERTYRPYGAGTFVSVGRRAWPLSGAPASSRHLLAKQGFAGRQDAGAPKARLGRLRGQLGTRPPSTL